MENKESMLKKGEKDNPTLTKILIFFAFAIPIAILAYVFYINYLPFGWEKTYELTINEQGVISPLSSEIYITNANGRRLLSLPEGVNGQINVVIEPKVALKNAIVNISIVGDENVFLGTGLKLDLNELNWNYNWDFTKGIPEDLNGTAEFREDLGCVYFDATKEQTLALPNSSDMFESGPMSIYVKYKPSETSRILGDYQRLIGHYNWEIYQGEESIRFQVGRMNNENGISYSINYPIDSEIWFEKEHELLAVYSPDNLTGEGYIELFVDRNFVERIDIKNNAIYGDYNTNKNLGIGRSTHNYDSYPYFDGCIYKAKIIGGVIVDEQLYSDNFKFNVFPISIPIIGKGNLNSIKIDVFK